MTDANNFQPFGPNFDSIMAEVGKMKENGASNTQIRAFLEEKGWSGIKFDTDDIATNPGVEPQNQEDINASTLLADAKREHALYPRGEFTEIDSKIFAKPVQGKPYLSNEDIAKIVEVKTSKHFGVLSSLSNSTKTDHPVRALPDKSVGERETTIGELRGVYLPEFNMEENLGMKLPDELAERLRNLDFNQMPSPISPEFAADLEKIRDVQSQAILANLEAAGASDTGIGPRGTVSFMDPPFSAPFKRFAPVFDAAVARRHIYKDLLNRMNEEIKQGPLAGIVFFTGVTNSLPHIAPAQFVFSVTWTHKARNRMKAYNTYFTNLRIKYMQEIAETDAAEEKKVMERE